MKTILIAVWIAVLILRIWAARIINRINLPSGETMRPRIVRLPDGGEVTIKNVDPAKADAIKAFLLGATAETQPEPAPVNTGEYTNKAISVTKENGKFKVVTLKFDPVAGVGVVESTQESFDKYDAIMQFKKLAVELDFV